jgi:hypothetical protein
MTTHLSIKIFSYTSKHLFSSCSFASTFSSSGYFSCGKSAPGQSYAGMSSYHMTAQPALLSKETIPGKVAPTL